MYKGETTPFPPQTPEWLSVAVELSKAGSGNLCEKTSVYSVDDIGPLKTGGWQIQHVAGSGAAS